MNKPVQVTIAEPYDSFVESQLESGVFKSAEDVVEAGLKLLKEEQARIECENSGPSVPFDREEFKALMRERQLRSRASQES
jgi:antitoxin ParD1/3/4